MFQKEQRHASVPSELPGPLSDVQQVPNAPLTREEMLEPLPRLDRPRRVVVQLIIAVNAFAIMLGAVLSVVLGSARPFLGAVTACMIYLLPRLVIELLKHPHTHAHKHRKNE